MPGLPFFGLTNYLPNLTNYLQQLLFQQLIFQHSLYQHIELGIWINCIFGYGKLKPLSYSHDCRVL